MSEAGDFLDSVDPGSPIVAMAIHDGHAVRPEVAGLLTVSEYERLREEDPFTGEIARVAPSWLIGQRSRFEIDLNRPRDQAIYRTPEQVWGLDIWRETPSDDVLQRSLMKYDAFYEFVDRLLRELLERHKHVVVLDLHSYNHRRNGPLCAADDPLKCPEINIGTGSIDREYWGNLVDRFIADLRAYPHQGRQLDVRENVKFQGGHLSKWIHRTFPNSVCAIAVEFKKCFMDEWTGEPNQERIAELASALHSTFPGLFDSLDMMREKSRRMDMEHSS